MMIMMRMMEYKYIYNRNTKTNKDSSNDATHMTGHPEVTNKRPYGHHADKRTSSTPLEQASLDMNKHQNKTHHRVRSRAESRKNKYKIQNTKYKIQNTKYKFEQGLGPFWTRNDGGLQTLVSII